MIKGTVSGEGINLKLEGNPAEIAADVMVIVDAVYGTLLKSGKTADAKAFKASMADGVKMGMMCDRDDCLEFVDLKEVEIKDDIKDVDLSEIISSLFH